MIFYDDKTVSIDHVNKKTIDANLSKEELLQIIKHLQMENGIKVATIADLADIIKRDYALTVPHPTYD